MSEQTDEWRQKRMLDLSERLGGNAPLGRALGYKDGAFVRQMIEGERPITEKTVAKAERLPGCLGWFDAGRGDAAPPIKSTEASRSPGAAPDNNVQPLVVPYGVPLISWVQAGSWSEIADPYVPGDAEDWLPCPIKHGPRTYCLRVRGDSMNNPGTKPSYADGDILFVDPDRGAKPGDRVIVRLDDQQEATFKQLLVEDGRKMLKALNPEWKPRYVEINGNATITGVIIGKWVPE